MSLVGRQGYKQTPIGLIPLDWSETTLGNEVESIIGGGTPSKDVVAYWGGDIPWASVKDFVGSRLSKTQDYITPQAIDASATNLIPAGTLITPTRMALGRVAIFDCDVAINQDLKAIFPKPSLLRDFLFYWFQENADRIEAAGTGSTVKGIRLEVLREFGLALPPIPEQQKIAAILTAVDDKLDVIARQIEATKTLKRGLMQTLFSRGVGTQDADGHWVPHTEFKDSELGKIPVGWEIHPIGYATRIVNGNAFKSSDFSESGIPVIRISNIKPDFSVNLMGGVFFAEDEKLRRFKVESGDMLIAMSGATTGKVGRFKGEGFCYLNQRVGRFEVDKARLSPDFLFHFLRKSSTQDLLLGAAAGGAQPNISAGSIEAIQLSFPPVFEQHRIAEILNSIDTKQDTIQKRRRLLGILKRGLMQKLLTGEWRVSVDASASDT